MYHICGSSVFDNFFEFLLLHPNHKRHHEPHFSIKNFGQKQIQVLECLVQMSKSLCVISFKKSAKVLLTEIVPARHLPRGGRCISGENQSRLSLKFLRIRCTKSESEEEGAPDFGLQAIVVSALKDNAVPL